MMLTKRIIQTPPKGREGYMKKSFQQPFRCQMSMEGKICFRHSTITNNFEYSQTTAVHRINPKVQGADCRKIFQIHFVM